MNIIIYIMELRCFHSVLHVQKVILLPSKMVYSILKFTYLEIKYFILLTTSLSYFYVIDYL